MLRMNKHPNGKSQGGSRIFKQTLEFVSVQVWHEKNPRKYHYCFIIVVFVVVVVVVVVVLLFFSAKVLLPPHEGLRLVRQQGWPRSLRWTS